MIRLALCLLCLCFGGCAVADAAWRLVPEGEVCFLYKGAQVCAVKRDGKWFLRADLAPEDRAAVLEKLEHE